MGSRTWGLVSSKMALGSNVISRCLRSPKIGLRFSSLCTHLSAPTVTCDAASEAMVCVSSREPTKNEKSRINHAGAEARARMGGWETRDALTGNKRVKCLPRDLITLGRYPTSLDKQVPHAEAASLPSWSTFSLLYCPDLIVCLFLSVYRTLFEFCSNCCGSP